MSGFSNYINLKIGLCSDHGGYLVKERLLKILTIEMTILCIDYGTYSLESCHYPDYVKKASDGYDQSEVLLIFGSCTTGQGVNITANHYGFRSALIYNLKSAEMAVRHNNANFFVFPAIIFEEMDDEELKKYIKIILETSFEGGRHLDRINMIPN